MYWNKNYLYHYTSFESAVKILSSGKLLFSDFRRLNDINESCGPAVIYSGFSDKEKSEFEKELSNYKQISFTMDKPGRKGFDIPAIWGHYAHRGEGVCLVFDKEKLDEDMNTEKSLYSKEVEYFPIQDLNELTYYKQYGVSFEEFIDGFKDSLFFHKTKDWQYEQEYRIIAISDEIDWYDVSRFLIAVVLFNRSHDKFLNSVEYISLSRINPQLAFYRYTPGLGDVGNLFDCEGNKIWPPSIIIDFKRARNAKEE